MAPNPGFYTFRTVFESEEDEVGKGEYMIVRNVIHFESTWMVN